MTRGAGAGLGLVALLLLAALSGPLLGPGTAAAQREAAAVPEVALHDVVLDAAVSRAPVPFAMVAFTAPGDVRFRVSADGRAWGPWRTAEAMAWDEGPDGAVDPADRVAGVAAARPTEPVWVGPARWLEVDGLGAGPVEAHLIDPLGLGRPLLQRAGSAVAAVLRSALRPASAVAAPRAPRIVSRAQWGADESWRRGSPAYRKGFKGAVVHHTAGTNAYRPEHSAAIVRGIYAYHTRRLGWNDIGYHLLVDRYGVIFEGRAGGLDRAVVGAHAGGFNGETFGLAILGEFGGGLPPAAALEAASQALAWKLAVHEIPAEGTVELTSRGSTRYPSGQRVRVHRISGHRDLSRTACPGDALYAELPALRSRTARLMERAEDPPPRQVPLLPLPL